MLLIQKFILPFIVLFFSAACKKEVKQTPAINEEIATARPGGGGGTTNVQGECDYDIGDPAGWNKVFEENFSTNDFTKWNIWYGGAFNNELQLYQSSNLSITNGNLEIAPQQQNVTGPTNPWDATPKNFTYTSGRV